MIATRQAISMVKRALTLFASDFLIDVG